MLCLPDHFQTAWPGFQSWELAQDLSDGQLNSSIKTGSYSAKHVMGLSGLSCSLSEVSKSAFPNTSTKSNLRFRANWSTKTAGAASAFAKAELRKLSPFSVQDTFLALMHFCFNNKSNSWVGKFPLAFPSLERYTHVELLEMLMFRWMGRTCKSSLCHHPQDWVAVGTPCPGHAMVNTSLHRYTQS